MGRHRTKLTLAVQPQRSCGKNRYISENEARQVADQQELLFANQGLALQVYHCSFCGGWHLTKQADNKIARRPFDN